MNKLFLIFLCSSLILGFTACEEETKYSGEIKELNSLSSSVDRMLVELQRIDTAELANIKADVEQNLLNMKRVYHADTINMEDAELLQDYKAIKQATKKLSESRRALIEELKYSNKQLESLAADLEDNLLEAEKVQKFMEDEKLAVKNQLLKGQQLLDHVDYVKENYPELNPAILKILNREMKEDQKENI